LISLQTELLQLHLLHQSSAEVSRQWELSAKRSLHRKFEEVTSLYQAMRDVERQAQEQQNIRALRDWNGDNASFVLAEHIQILCGPLHELPSLVGPDGRYTSLIADFQQWSAWVEEMWSSREEGAGENMDLDSAESLGDAWKAENAALTRRLTAYSRELDRLTPPTHGSSIASIVATCKELLGGMLDELQIMQRIEAGVVATEKDWIEVRLKAISCDIGAHASTEECEVWKS
jgi:transposase